MSFTSLDFSAITSEGYIVYSVDSGFKVLVEDTEEGVTYFTEPSTSPLTSLGSCIMQGALLTTISGSFSGISARDRALVKVDSSWATVTSFIDNNNVILDRTFDTARLCTFSGSTVTTRNNFVAGTKITFRTTAQLPTGIAANTTYYVLTATTETFTFSATLGGSAITPSGGIGRHSVYRVYTVQTTTYSPDRISDTIVAKVTRTGTSPNFVYDIEPYYSVQSDSELTAVPTLPDVGSYVGQVVLNIQDGVIYTWDGTFWVANSTEIIRSADAPENPTVGQLWFRTTDSLLFTRSGSEWIQVVSATPGTRYINVTTESGLYTGELVTNTVDNNLYRWDGSVWVLVSDTSILDLSNEAHTIPTDFNNTTPDFTGAGTTVRVYSGGNDVTNLWTLSDDPVGVTGAFGNGTNWPTNEYRISAISLDAAYVDFTATRGAYTRTARFTLSLARGGEDGVPATVFRVVPSVFAVKELNGNFTPSTIRFDSYLVSSGYTAANSDFKFYTSNDGATFTPITPPNLTNVSFYDLSTPNTKFLRVEIYVPGTNILRDIETLPYISDGVNGNSGSTAIQIDLSNENASILTDINGTNINLSDAVTTVRIYEGTSDATTGWAITATPSDGVTVNNVSNTYTVTGFTGTTGFVDFTAIKDGFSSLTARFSLIKVTSGNIYKLNSSVDSIVKNSAGTYLPTVVTFSSERTTVAGTASYLGKFIIATSTDGASFTTSYTSEVDESSVAYTVPADIVAIRANLYLAGSTTLVDSETIPIVTNGTNARGVNLTAGTQVFTYNAAGTTPNPIDTVVTAAPLNTVGTVFYEFLVNGSSVQNTETPTRTITAPTNIANTTVEVRIREGTNSSTVLARGQITIAGVRPGVNGAPGTAAVSGYLTNESQALFAYANGIITSYAPATGSFVIVSGNSDVSSNFTLSTVSNPQNLTVNYTNRVYTVSAGFDANEDSATLTIRATGSGAYAGVTIDKVFSLSKVKGGYEIVSGLPGPGDPRNFVGSVVFLTTDNKLYRYNGTAWVASVPAVDITGQLTAAQIASLAASQITGQLTDAQLASIAAAKIAGQLSDTQLAAIASTKITGQLTDAQLAGIAAAKLTGTITGTQISDGAISTAKISAGAVTAASIAADTITAANIAAGAITASELAAGAVTAGKIAAGTIVAADIAADTITANKIAANAITATELNANAVTADKISAGAVTAAKIAVTSLSAITASMGSLSVDGTLTIGTTGKLISAGTAFNTNGIFLGYDSGAYKFSVGNGASKLTYDGTTLTLPSSTIGGDVNKFSPFRSVAPTSWTNATEITFLEVDLPASTHPEGHKPFAIGTGYMEGDDDYSYRFKMYMRSNTAVPLILGTPASAGSLDDGKGNITYYITYNSFVSISSGSTLSSTGKSHLVNSTFFDAGVTTIYYSLVSGVAFTTSDSITATPSTNFVLVSETRHRPFGNFKTNFSISGSSGSNSTGTVTTKFTVQRFNVQDTAPISSSTGADAIIEITGMLMGVR
jgi:hypothetical protein